MPGQLLTNYFLTDGIRTTPEWRTSVDAPQDFAAFRKGVAELFDSFADYSAPKDFLSKASLSNQFHLFQEAGRRLAPTKDFFGISQCKAILDSRDGYEAISSFFLNLVTIRPLFHCPIAW